MSGLSILLCRGLDELTGGLGRIQELCAGQTLGEMAHRVLCIQVFGRFYGAQAPGTTHVHAAF